MPAAGVEEVDEVDGGVVDGHDDFGGVVDGWCRDRGDGQVSEFLELGVLVHQWVCYRAGLGTSTNPSITIAFIASAFWEL